MRQDLTAAAVATVAAAVAASAATSAVAIIVAILPSLQLQMRVCLRSRHWLQPLLQDHRLWPTAWSSAPVLKVTVVGDICLHRFEWFCQVASYLSQL
mmetsp:Transcript_135614/g.270595  ORF Transcript_135614/g.270595 Transcript_135614/m.270595 type:complete len:97 (-) Transcript_135614:180-470(-)